MWMIHYRSTITKIKQYIVQVMNALSLAGFSKIIVFSRVTSQKYKTE